MRQNKTASYLITVLLLFLAGWMLNGGLSGISTVPFAFAATESTTVLYDAAQSNTPDQQKFLYLTDPFFSASATQTFVNGATTLDSTPVKSDKAGYFTWRAQIADVPILNRTDGFRLDFSVQVQSEDHAGSDKDGDNVGDRAGFSVILLANDAQGIELGFWADEIWAQEDGAAQPPSGTLFTHAEGVAHDTTTGLINYSLEIDGNTYTLSVDGTPILTGAVRDYTPFGDFPYTQPNFIFLGDNTSSAKALIRFSYAAITTDTAVSPTSTPTATHTSTPLPTNTPTATATSTPDGAADPTSTPTATATIHPSITPEYTIRIPFLIKP
jgi:hypothetical protein